MDQLRNQLSLLDITHEAENEVNDYNKYNCA